MIDDTNLIPYSLYLPRKQINQLKEMAKNRQASSFIRDALIMALEKNEPFTSGYNKGLRDACKVVQETKEVEMVAIKGKPLSEILIEQIHMLEENGK
jgi:hypothetical protein